MPLPATVPNGVRSAIRIPPTAAKRCSPGSTIHSCIGRTLSIDRSPFDIRIDDPSYTFLLLLTPSYSHISSYCCVHCCCSCQFPSDVSLPCLLCLVADSFHSVNRVCTLKRTVNIQHHWSVSCELPIVPLRLYSIAIVLSGDDYVGTTMGP